MESGQIKRNTEEVRRRLDEAVRLSGRPAGSVCLLAATKTRTPEEIRACIAAGIDACGENRAQELLEKLPLGAYTGKPVHFIGSFQTNKAHLLVGKVDMVESVGSMKAGAALGRLSAEKGIVTDILAEVNIGCEAEKAGVVPEKAAELCELLANTEGVRLRGIMAIPPAGEDGTPYFVRMRELFESLGKNLPAHFDTLSMGMSGDFEKAAREGATIVRVGTAIFGERNYGTKK
ncbi:MAG: YggS family pyridoxal phosphate-dependent enzyme [Eubacteriales bacterium]